MARSQRGIVRSWYGRLERSIAPLCAACALATAAHAEPLSAYLPLNLEPEMERQIERVLILADEPILKRPFPVELVRTALPDACRKDAALCARVRRYLERYSYNYGITHASATAAATGGAHSVLPNQHGETSNDDWELSASGYVQPSDYLLASVGGIAYSGRTQATGTMLSVGASWAQLDAGYRDHWLSPMTDTGSMLFSTESPTSPSVTLSNWEPLTRLGLQYEFALSRLSQTSANSGASVPGNNLLYQGVAGRGDPHVFSMQLSIEPFPGWSFGFNRNLEYGGGDGLPSSARFLLRDFFRPSGQSQNQGNQQASYVSRFIFPGRTPFAVYFQYAGEDNSNGGSYLLGNAALSAGIDFPRIGRHFDATYEVSEWQNIWYVHFIYLDGMTNYGDVLGTWGADHRVFGDGVGARSQMLRLGWEPPFGGYLEARARTLVNQDYYAGGGEHRQYAPGQPPPYPYHQYYDVSLTYSRQWGGLTVGAEATAGRDVDGDSFTRFAAFLRYGGAARSGDDDAGYGADGDEPGDAPGVRGAEWFVDAGVGASQVRTDPGPPNTTSAVDPITTSAVSFAPHFGLGARRAVSAHDDLGVRLELDQVEGHSLIGVRAIDYRHRYGDSFGLSLFAGVDRYDLATPAYSVYGGVGVEWRNFLPGLRNWSVGLDLRYGQNIARDKVLPTDVSANRPDT
ncbi:MAG TPA: capsule assembly Wzi family protein, partial [Steroidobacteraceae bacterium]|nr:capsule assembly Wzi family protein [Steroidobacteraceae bacterium]